MDWRSTGGQDREKDNELLRLTATQYSSWPVCKNAGKVLTHQYLLREIWATTIPTIAIPAVFIANCVKRSKRTSIIGTYYHGSGVGYRFVAGES